jgi:16S rRNA (adenine1518-N6/adenine1519-N6)-dimethyltransferase
VTHSRLASPSATRAVLDAHGLTTKKRLGQHFLVDDNVVGRILQLADLKGGETVLEVGPGIGTLTEALCEAAGCVVAVEQDDALVPVLAETTAGCERFALIHADAVGVSAVALERPFGPPHALVANLPYGVAATVLLRFFEELPSLQMAVVMVQAEVADRIAARPGTKDYGSYTVKLRLHADTIARFAVARSCFMPPPRVDSAVVRLERRTRDESAESLVAAALAADAAFTQRRKTIRNSLRASLDAPSSVIEGALVAAAIDGAVRAETLEPEAFIALGRALSAAGALPL